MRMSARAASTRSRAAWLAGAAAAACSPGAMARWGSGGSRPGRKRARGGGLLWAGDGVVQVGTRAGALEPFAQRKGKIRPRRARVGMVPGGSGEHGLFEKRDGLVGVGALTRALEAVPEREAEVGESR